MTPSPVSRTIHVPAGYLEYAHGPAAESGHEPALRLFEIKVKGVRICVELDDAELREELKDVAELYADGKGEEYPRRHVGTARRILQKIETFEAQDS